MNAKVSRVCSGRTMWIEEDGAMVRCFECYGKEWPYGEINVRTQKDMVNIVVSG
jgi:hypothetical protein